MQHFSEFDKKDDNQDKQKKRFKNDNPDIIVQLHTANSALGLLGKLYSRSHQNEIKIFFFRMAITTRYSSCNSVKNNGIMVQKAVWIYFDVTRWSTVDGKIDKTKRSGCAP